MRHQAADAPVPVRERMDVIQPMMGRRDHDDPSARGPRADLKSLVEVIHEGGEASKAHKSKFIQNLSCDRLYGLCSEEMKMWLDIECSRCGKLDFHSFVIAAQKRSPELGSILLPGRRPWVCWVKMRRCFVF